MAAADSARSRKRVVVHGRVQGVWFRGSTQQCARAQGVAGWVRNRPDGSVEAVFEGPALALERVIDFCRTGPRGAEVERVDVSDEAPEGLTEFSIR